MRTGADIEGIAPCAHMLVQAHAVSRPEPCQNCGLMLGSHAALYHIHSPGDGPLCAACVAADPFLEEPHWRSKATRPAKQPHPIPNNAHTHEKVITIAPHVKQV